MQKNSFSKLSISIKSKGRFNGEKKSNLRSPYQRDRDRIIHSTAFRRLKHKTQVFVNTSGDHYRTRITHSLEVAQISRTLAKYFNLNEDLSETLSLAHDLGHTPFGHAGEEALHNCMIHYGGFDHNIQTIRIVTLLENRYYNFNGLNLSLETLDGLIKHNGPVRDLKKFNSILGKNFFKKKINFIDSPSIEAQIASISDDIAYNSHDLEDGLRAGLFKLKDLKHVPVLNSILKKNNIKSINDVYKSQYPIVCFSNKMKLFDINIKKFLKKNMYYHRRVIYKTNFGKKIIKHLFLKIKKNPTQYIDIRKMKKNNKDRAICDFIAGMTDRFAINLYNKLK